MRRGTNLPWVGDYNQAVVLDGIRRHPGTSRTDLVDATGLSVQTVSNIVRRLLDRDLVVEGAADRARPGPRVLGKPRTALSVRPGAALAVGVQVDRGHLVAVLLDLTGEVVDVVRSRVGGPAVTGAEEVVAEVARLVRALTSRGPRGAAVHGVGVAVPGPLDVTGPVRTSAINLPGWHHVAVEELLAADLDLPVLVENDATACAVGDLWCGRRAGRSFLYVHVGSGIGGGLVLRDEVVRGTSGNAGEIGHVVVDPRGRACSCGSRGCLEAQAAPGAVVTAYVEAAGRAAALRAGLGLGPHEQLEDHELLAALAGRGDRLAAGVLARAADDVALAVLGVVNVVDVPEVVVGGPALRRGSGTVRDAVRRRLETAALARDVRTVQVHAGSTGEHAGAVGAASAVLHEALSASWATAAAPGRVVIGPVAPVH